MTLTYNQFFSLGASSGIGAVTAELFTKLGASIAITGRKENNLANVGFNCQKHGEKVEYVVSCFNWFFFLIFYL